MPTARTALGWPTGIGRFGRVPRVWLKGDGGEGAFQTLLKSVPTGSNFRENFSQLACEVVTKLALGFEEHGISLPSRAGERRTRLIVILPENGKATAVAGHEFQLSCTGVFMVS